MTPSFTRVVAVLQEGTWSLADLAEAAHVCKEHARACLKSLKGQIHIAGWIRSRVGPPVPTYRWGPGKDACRPGPLTPSQKGKRYRRKLREKFGENYGLIHEAQKHRIPGRRIVIGGEVIYEQTLR
jgi:hypothetical protein